MIESISIALYLPAPDIEALIQQKTIVAMPRRYFNREEKFALYPVNFTPDRTQQEYYNPNFLETANLPSEQSTSETISLQAWAKCEKCEILNNREELDILSQLTIWTKTALENILSHSSYLFLAYLRVYQLSEALSIPPTPDAENKLGKIAGLSQAIAIAKSHPVFDDEVFSQECKRIETRQLLQPKQTNNIDSPLPNPPISSPINPIKYEENDLEWISKIAEIGNSSDGDEFEKLARRSLIFLGFSNSNKNKKASLDPEKIGGSGGLDFYAEEPYLVVGECKATKTEKVSDGTPAQLVKLGHNILQKDRYESCVKIIFAAGELNSYANQTALSNQMNVIRPETLQKLVQLKANFSGTIDLFTLKTCLEREPFGEAADRKVNEYCDRIINNLKLRSQLVQKIKQLQKNTGALSINIDSLHGAYYSSNQPLQYLKPNEMHEILIELSSPLTGYLGREKKENWQSDRFYFLQDLTLENL